MTSYGRAAQWFGRTQADPGTGTDSGPRKKPRGNRRYYRALARQAHCISADLSAWYNLSHWHTDLGGRGNGSWRARRAHLAALVAMYSRLLGQLSQQQVPWQSWVLIDPNNSANDSLYLHTPNPHTAFPVNLKNVDWDAPVPDRLREFVRDDWQFGRSDTGGTRFYIRPR